MGVKGGSNSSSGTNSNVNQNTSQNAGANGSVGMNYSQNQSGQQSNNSSSGSSWGSSQSAQDVWGAQAPHLENVYNSAGDAYANAQQGINNLQPSVSNDMANFLGQASGGYGNQMGGGFAAGLQGQVGPNSYTGAMKDMIAGDAQRMKQQNLGGLDARAAASGMSGSTGYHNSANQMASEVDRNAQNAMANVGYQSYNQGIQNQMQLANMMDRNQQFGVGNLQNLQQGSMNQFNPHMAGLNAAGAYGQIIGGPTVLGTSSSSNGSQNSSQGSSSGFSNGVSYGMNQSGGYTGSNSYGAGVGQGNQNSSGWNAGVSYV